MIDNLTHPQYDELFSFWKKWRLTYKGGWDFINEYTTKFTKRESDSDFKSRKEMSYCPAFAKAAVNDIKNAIFQRTTDITREGGPISYLAAVNGLGDGVDLLGSSMNSFIGRQILPELLTMAKVGIFIDMPILTGQSIADVKGKRPYMYMYKAEDIRSWAKSDYSDPNEYSSLLLRDYSYVLDKETKLPTETKITYRHLWMDQGRVWVQFYNEEGDILSSPIILNIGSIPFVTLEITSSLLADVSDYQIALLNLSSSDISYALKSNFPFYTEQFDPRTESPFIRRPNFDDPGEKPIANNQEIKVGVSSGRRYPINTERPNFIHPSAEPLRASMEKQEMLKQEIRQLVNLAVESLTSSSADSKSMDQQGLESGLSYIGLELEHAERQIAKFWSMYEGTGEVPTIHYPKKFSIKTEEDRRKDAKALQELMVTVPSVTFQKEMAKQIVNLTIGSKIATKTLNKINKEISVAATMTSDPKAIIQDVENGLVDLETASLARGYPQGAVDKAKIDHAERLKRIVVSQTPDMGARGVDDLSLDTEEASDEKQRSRDNTEQDVVKDRTRGEAK